MAEEKTYEELTIEEKVPFLEETLDALNEKHEDLLEDLRALVCFITEIEGIIPEEEEGDENEQINHKTSDKIDEILKFKFQRAIEAGYRGSFEDYKKINEGN